MKKVNYHTHTELCRHAAGMEADYVQKALEKKMDVLGFSDHAPYPDNRYGLRMEYHELTPHIERLKKLQQEYRGRLDIRIGLEIEYAEADRDYYEMLLNEAGVEYLLLGQHIFRTSAGEEVNTYFIEQTKDTGYYLEYARSIEAGMRAGYFKAVAHPDLFFINELPLDENCGKACDIIINAAAETNTILEFNANGLRRGKKQYPDGLRYPYPHYFFWEKVSRMGIPVLINSDCHNPDNLWDEVMEDAYRLAEKWGLNVINGID